MADMEPEPEPEPGATPKVRVSFQAQECDGAAAYLRARRKENPRARPVRSVEALSRQLVRTTAHLSDLEGRRRAMEEKKRLLVQRAEAVQKARQTELEGGGRAKARARASTQADAR